VSKVLDFCLIQDLIKPFSGIARLRSLKSRTNIAEAIAQLLERLHAARATEFILICRTSPCLLRGLYCNDASLEIHILPAKAVLFPATHTRVQGQIKFSLMSGARLANFGPKVGLFFIV
jgi:hypothetical protein